jgi:methylenetetrahydrofolate--tRNA-(uracil-5-)-methyltransferase
MIDVIGGGFAGCEAAWIAARLGAKVRLWEMRPAKPTPAHKTGLLAELVCSNSFKSSNRMSPAGQLKWEMEQLGSLMIPTALKHHVPGGEALCVDREAFASEMTSAIKSHPRIELIRDEWTGGDTDHPVVVATGPLSSEAICRWIESRTGSDRLFFFDAVSPTVTRESIDFCLAWEQDRYDKGDGSYVNCPMNREEYEAFVSALLSAEPAAPHLESETRYFEGCMPIEVIAQRGRESLRFGNFKPVGLTNPHTGARAYAVLQLRQENAEKSLYSMVACQTTLKWPEQKRVFRMVPGLQNAEFVRYGVMHRNTYLDSPRLLDARLRLRDSQTFFAGQITGVEGYVESGATGILAGLFACASDEIQPPPRECALGSLIAHVTNTESPDYAPMNINWGLFPDPGTHGDKSVRREAKLKAATEAFLKWRETLPLP